MSTQPRAQSAMPRVLAFDVFGTVVDWFGTIAREVDALGLGVNGGEFALAWRAGYAPAMDRVRKGELGWTRIDALHRMILDDILERFGIDTLDESARRALNLVWHRLDAWPDSASGLARLRSRFTVCALSNGNLSLLADMARHAGLPWDLILSAEVFRHYKPDPETYLGVCDVFDIAPGQMMMVAAHESDLAAARACGCRTAFVERPLEYGPDSKHPLPADAGFDLRARSIEHLAELLGC
ncbi:MAG: haloacid dehalogenase type II [Burkholderiales bacterium]|nr:MAG: haloacid dehalogenase type II [Burkholderiales bacterium]